MLMQSQEPKKGQRKVPTLKKTTWLCPSRFYSSMLAPQAVIAQHNAIALANLPPPQVPGLAEHQAAEAQVHCCGDDKAKCRYFPK